MGAETDSAALAAHGVDVCATEDTAFAGCASRDADVLARVLADLDGVPAAAKASRSCLFMVNLLGCQDAESFCVGAVDAASARLPALSFAEPHEKPDPRLFAANVLDDDPRHATRTVDALRRLTRLHDSVRGAPPRPCADAVSADVIALHRYCWRILQRIDGGLSKIVHALRHKGLYDDTNIYLYSDHAVGLHEHGVSSDAPWESCLRCFLVRKAGGVPAGVRVVTPRSLCELSAMVLGDCRIHADWHVKKSPPSHACLTVGLAASWLARAAVPPATDPASLRTFFVRTLVRHNDRHYSVVVWFSLSDLAGGEANLSAAEESRSFANPLRKHSLAELQRRGHDIQIYEHETDPHELDNLAWQAGWLDNALSRHLKHAIDGLLAHHRLETIRFTVPARLAGFGPDRVARDAPRPTAGTKTRSVGTQTEAPREEAVAAPPPAARFGATTAAKVPPPRRGRGAGHANVRTSVRAKEMQHLTSRR